MGATTPWQLSLSMQVLDLLASDDREALASWIERPRFSWARSPAARVRAALPELEQPRCRRALAAYRDRPTLVLRQAGSSTYVGLPAEEGRTLVVTLVKRSDRGVLTDLRMRSRGDFDDLGELIG